MADETNESTEPTNENVTGETPSDDFKSEGSKQRVLADLAAARAEAKEAKILRAKLQEYEDAQKSELEKLTEQASSFEARALAAETALVRAEVAAAAGLTPKQAKRLAGVTREELEADAAELAAEFGSRPVTGGNPVGALKPGASPASNETTPVDRNAWMRATHSKTH